MINLILSIALPMILIFLVQKHKNRSNMNLPQPQAPVAPGLPLIGNLHQLASAPIPHMFLSQLSKIHGPLLRLNLGSTPVVVISSAKLAKEVLKKQDSAFCSRPKLVAQQRLSYNGVDVVFAPYGAQWREMRRIASAHLLSPHKVQAFRAVREDEVARMVAKIGSSSGSGEAVNLSEAAMGLTTTLICRIGFGRRYEDLTRFQDMLNQLRHLLSTFFVSDYFPALGWLDALSGSVKRLELAFHKLDSFYQDLIDDHLRRQGDDDHILGMQIKLELDSTAKPNWDRVKALLMVNLLFFSFLS